MRKAAGAGRGALIVQFLGETLLHVLLGVCIAVALVEVTLPPANAFLETGATFDYWRDPKLVAWICAGALVLGALAGFYPAFVLSAFHPIDVLQGRGVHAGGAALRRLLVTLQFAVLIGLIIAAGIVHQQRRYATEEALRVDTDQILLIHGLCNKAFKTELGALPGVRGVACSQESLLTRMAFGNFRLKDGSIVTADMCQIEADVLKLYGLEPLAGRFVAMEGGGSVINETAARRLGFSSPAAAIGQLIPFAAEGDGTFQPRTGNTIVGVVADFSINTVNEKIRPAIYRIDPHFPPYELLTVKLSGHRIPETLAAIDRLWSKTGADTPINREFLDDYIQNLYRSVQRQAQALGALSGVAMLLACLGLIGLSAATAERRTKEIGVRKALGANHGSIVRLLLWQFAKPVLWANVIAWPAAGYLMHHWLEGFAYHVELKLWLFIASTALALVIALLTVSAHCLMVARVKPVQTLRYE